MMSISIAKSITTIGLPVIITSNNPHLNFIVDTGSNLNFIFDFVHDGLENYFLPIESTTTETISVNGKIEDIPMVKGSLEFDGKVSEVEFSVINADVVVKRFQENNGFQLHGFLGVPFLVANKWVLDFDKMEIKSK